MTDIWNPRKLLSRATTNVWHILSEKFCRWMWSYILVAFANKLPQVTHAIVLSCVWVRRCSFSLCLLRTTVPQPAKQSHLYVNVQNALSKICSSKMNSISYTWNKVSGNNNVSEHMKYPIHCKTTERNELRCLQCYYHCMCGETKSYWHKC